jgi:CelD/BcsL family acetyltransferase involved in cellulose biosynthesis
MGARVLGWLGGRASDYHGPLLGADWPRAVTHIDMKALWRQIARRLPRFDVVHFQKQPEIIAGHPNPFLALGAEGTPSMASAGRLIGSWDEAYRERRSAKSRRTISKKWRNLAGQGTVTITVDVRDPARIDRVMAALTRMKEDRIRRIGGRPLFSGDHVAAFYRDLTHARPGAARVLLSAMELDGRVIAAHWGLVHKGRLYSLLPSYDEAHATVSPGLHLMLSIMEWCCDNGVTVFDFTIGDEGYKEKWSDETLRLIERVRLRRARGLGYVARVRAGHAARRLARRMPALRRIKPTLRQWATRLGWSGERGTGAGTGQDTAASGSPGAPSPALGRTG